MLTASWHRINDFAIEQARMRVTIRGWATCIAALSLGLALCRYMPLPAAFAVTVLLVSSGVIFARSWLLRCERLLTEADEALVAGEIGNAERLAWKAFRPWRRYDADRLPKQVIERLWWKAAILVAEKRYLVAEPILRRAKAAAEANELENDALYGELCNTLAACLTLEGKFREAADISNAVLTAQRSDVLVDPAVLIRTTTELAVAELTFNLENAIALLEQALRLAEARAAKDPSMMAFCHAYLGGAYMRAGNLQAAKASYECAIEFFNRINASASARVMALWTAAAMYCSFETELERAEELSARAVAICLRDDVSGRSESYLVAAYSKMLCGKLEDAARLCRVACQLNQSSNEVSVCAGLHSATMASIQARRGMPDEANASYLDALATVESTGGIAELNLPFILCRFGQFLLDRDRVAEAEPIILRCWSKLEDDASCVRLYFGDCLHLLGRLSACKQDWLAAASWLRRAVDVRTQCYGTTHPRTIESRELLQQASALCPPRNESLNRD